MGEHLFRVLLSDIKTVRVICKCGAALELPIGKVELAAFQCPSCDSVIGTRRGHGMDPADAITALAVAFEKLEAAKDSFTIEFPIKIPN